MLFQSLTFRSICLAACFALVALNALWMLRERPLVYVEGVKNLEARRPFDQQIPQALRQALASRPGATVLMNTSVYPELVAFTGIPFRQTINESDLWIWEHALLHPADDAQIVLAFAGDDVDRAQKAHPAGLRAVKSFQAPGQPEATLYLAEASPARASNQTAGR